MVFCARSIELTLQPRVLSSLKGASRLRRGCARLVIGVKSL